MGDAGIVMRAIQELLSCGHTVRHLSPAIWHMTWQLTEYWLPAWCNCAIACQSSARPPQELDGSWCLMADHALQIPRTGPHGRRGLRRGAPIWSLAMSHYEVHFQPQTASDP